MTKSLLPGALLLAPFLASADAPAAVPFSRAAWAYGDLEYRRAAAVLAEYNPTSQINLTIARP